jgi:single-strand DNA-binding protein
MSKSLNRVTLIGNLGRDAETKFTPSGISVTRFSVATTKSWKDKQTGEKKEETEWHNCTQWRAENLAPYLTKGKRVYIDGELHTRSYEKDGQKHYATEITVNDIILLDGGKADDQGGGMVSRPRGAAQPVAAGISDDDVPF